jgi:hypothetical protein
MTHSDEPILAKKWVLQFPTPNKLEFRLNRETTEATGEETISNFAVPSFNCLRMLSSSSESEDSNVNKTISSVKKLG